MGVSLLFPLTVRFGLEALNDPLDVSVCAQILVMDTCVFCLLLSGTMHSQKVFRGLIMQPVERNTMSEPHPETTTSLLVNTPRSTVMEQQWEGGILLN